MATDYDAVVLGGGPGGEVAVNTLLKAGKRIALVERELVGGECTNWGCIPSKTLLRPPELKGEAGRAAGVGEPPLDFRRLAEYRDYMVSNHDDSRRIAGYESRGVTVVKAAGTLVGPGRVEANGQVLEAEAIVVATGAEAVIPPIPGLQEAGFWTNREATELSELPRSAAFVGGGVVSVELAQFMARFGVPCTIIGPSLAAREDPRVSERLAEILEEDGIELRIGPKAERVRREGGERIVSLDNGDEVGADVVVVAVGRRPRTQNLGLENVGIEPGRRGIEVDERCRAGDGVWAIGDCAGGAFTHVAKYMARIACADILGRPMKADYRAVPRVLFTEPEIASVGLTEADAREQGIDAVSAVIDLPTTIARPYTYQENPKGTLGVIADRERGVLIGAFAMAPLAGEWIHQAVLAIRAEIPLSVLKDTIQQFPTFSEGFGLALRQLPDEEMLLAVDHCAHPMIDEELAAANSVTRRSAL
jgi:pyruvate/2-oxoglutarate dehydrogenase complex dihydrolipoamide dehydrogenase (E3) component